MKTFVHPIALCVLAVASIGFQPLAAKDDYKHFPKEKEGRWGAYTIGEAKEEAAKKRKPIAFLVVDARTEETSVKQAGYKTYWSLEKDCTMVVVMSNLMVAAKSRLDEAVFNELTSADLGKGMPKLMITNSDATVVLAKKNADELLAADEKDLKALAKEMGTLSKNPSALAAAKANAATSTAASPAPNPGAVVVKNPVAESWTNNSGQTIQAAVIEIAADKVVFQMPNGNRVDYPLSNLNPASLKRVEELKAANAQ